MVLENNTPFVLERFACFDKEGAETLVVFLKATFSLAPGQPPEIRAQQDPAIPADVFAGEPDKSGITQESDYLPPRPGAAVTLSGHAIPGTPGETEAAVVFRVGDLTQKALVFGDRQWDKVLGIPRITKAQPFDRIPLRWEYAFGGNDQSADDPKHWEGQSDNPVGKGFLARKSARPVAGTHLPNIEQADRQIRSPKDRPEPVGFAPVAPSWQPRASFAGTYDDEWKSNRAPLLPDDFDQRFFLSAPRALTSSQPLDGGEPCLVMGTTLAGRLEFNLPILRPRFRLRWPGGAIRLESRLDTVRIDTDALKMQLIFRAMAEVHGRLETLEAIEATLEK